MNIQDTHTGVGSVRPRADPTAVVWDAEAGAPERAPTRGDRDADDNDGLKISHNISINAPIYFLTALSLTTSPA